MILVLFALLLVLSIGIFTASETAFLCVEKTKIFSGTKKKWAEITQNFINNPAEFFSTILVCEDFLIVIASNLLTIFFMKNFGENWVFLSTIFLSFFSLIFAQLIPKSIALLYPESVLKINARVILYFKILLLPVTSLFSIISKMLADVFKSRSQSAIIRHQDIVFAISEYEKDTSLLAARLFDFSKRRVSEIMVPITIAVVCKKGDNFERFCNESQRIFRYIPVYDEQKNEVTGIINTKDFFFKGAIEVRAPFFVQEDEKCLQVFLKMKDNKEFIAIVQNKKKEVAGIITIYDLIEELVGAIREEK